MEVMFVVFVCGIYVRFLLVDDENLGLYYGIIFIEVKENRICFKIGCIEVICLCYL